MKAAILVLAAIALSGPASAQALLGAGCGGSAALITPPAAGTTQVVVVRDGCPGPARQVIQTMRPGERTATTIIVRRGEPSSPALITDTADRKDFAASSSARIVRVR
ncbi:hypothetical protein [Hyphomonas sp.]|uniref:hypothetical protein n=1 Tax=Hyphomonas sp. TaxID=87 RepID=UPI00391CEEBA